MEPGRRLSPRAGGAGLTLLLAGDVMIGRGIDQALEPSVDPELHERWIGDARRYLELAERAHGPIPEPLAPSHPWGDALDVIERADPDARIVNLETALTAGGRRWEGKGIHYRAHPAHAAVLTAAGVDACTLANNHVLDWGRTGLVDTLEALRDAGVSACGAGRDRDGAEAPAVVEAGDRRIRIFGLASPTAGVPAEWAASGDRSGVWLLPELSEAAAERVAGRIREGDGTDRGAGDGRRAVTVASIHWGGNWGHRVPGRQRRFARRLIETGAVDVVHGHSSHHPKGVEVRADRPILYGCGDLLNDYEGIADREHFRGELVVLYEVVLRAAAAGALSRLRLHPFRLRRFRLERPSSDDVEWLRRALDREGERTGTQVSTGPGATLEVRWADDGTEGSG